MQYRIFLFLLFIAFSLGSDAQEKRGMTPLDVAKLQSVGTASLSDDGQCIVYSVRNQADPLVENKSATYSLHVYDLGADSSMTLVTDGNVSDLRFRPGHATITFLNKLEGDESKSLYEVSRTGGTAAKIFSFETSISAYDWSPDGKTLAFLANKPEEEKEAVLPYEPELYEIDPTFRRPYLVMPGEGEPKEFMMEGHFTGLKWSPDGERIAFSITSTPFVDDLLMGQSIVIVNCGTMNLDSEVDHEGKLGDFDWSPDGKRLAFIAGADIHDPAAGRLFVAPVTGGKPERLEADWEGKFNELEWIDPNYIHFLGSESTASVHGLVSPDPIGYPTVINVSKGYAISRMDLSADGNSVAYIADTWEHPSELYHYRKTGEKMKRLTNSNPWLDDISLAKQEVITYKAEDGLEIDGILIHPLDREEGKRYPLITVVHGGPESHYDNGWMTLYNSPGQVGAAMGYAVFYPNYRGSTGRGLEFTLTSQADPAGKEFDDIVDGVDHLIGTGLVDKDKVGVTGGSYGGYATGWMATRYTDRFAAGVMFVGISNKVSKWGTTDIPNEEYLVHARKWVFDDYDFFLRRSPVYYAGQCKTPLLIMHGKEDTRVHPSQSMELYRHIKNRTTTPVELVFYPGEGHGNAKSTARYDYNLRLLAWFEKYLKEPGGRS